MSTRKLTLLLIAVLLLAGCTPASLSQPAAPAAAQPAVGAEPRVGVQPAQPVSPPPLGGPTLPAPAATPVATLSAPRSMLQEGVLTLVTGAYQFTEGPAVDAAGNVYFSDINAGEIYRWSPDGQVSVFRDGLNMPNGLAFDALGNLVVCEGGQGRLIAIDPQGQLAVLADAYNQRRFNEPNDLWIDAQGGIFFTDPVYQSPLTQEGEYVYYLLPDRSQVVRVITDLVRPNGIVGTVDGKTLYVADHGAGKTYAYDLGTGGTLSNKRQVIASGSDGLKVDAAGNLYLTTPNQVRIYTPAGQVVREIPTAENPTNLAFAGVDHRTLFITARTQAYTYRLPADLGAASGAASAAATMTTTSGSGFMLTSPDVTENGLLPMEYTCDGASSSLPLAWSGAPAGTKSYAIIMHHVASPTDVHWYLVVYNLPPETTSLQKNGTGGGTLGINSVNKHTAYTPPCSKGPGLKTYIYTVYALSAYPQLSVPAAQVNRQVLLDAIAPITLARAELHVQYARK
jgi:gluconolactonase